MNCKIIELEKEREEVQHEIVVLQRKRAELAVQITREWQKDALFASEEQPVEDSSEENVQPG